jgi:TetR/AcrR family transcriptional regulator, transcriptional repressor for nem operon
MNQTGNTREQIISSALKLLLQRGMNGFSYRDISKPLGVKNAAIHYHFPSKADLVKALIEENHRLLKKSTAEFMAYGGPAAPQLEGLFRYTRSQMEGGRPVCMVGALSVDFEELTEENKRSLDRFMKDTVDWLARVLETGRGQGEFDFRGEAQSKAVSILAMIQGARQLARIHGMKMLECTFSQIRTDLGVAKPKADA